MRRRVRRPAACIIADVGYYLLLPKSGSVVAVAVAV
jgi:hypothetical protein